MPSIVETPGSATANSFVSEVEMIAYMEARLNSDAWQTKSGTTLLDDEKRALVEATRELNRQTYVGKRVDDVQVLAWPRQLAVDPDDPNGNYFDTTEVPQRIKNACMELAWQFINAGTTDLASLPDTEGVKRKKIDVLETEYFEHGRREGVEQYPRVWEEIAPLLSRSSNLTAPLIRG